MAAISLIESGDGHRLGLSPARGLPSAANLRAFTAMVLSLMPAQTLLVQLAGLDALGIDTTPIRAALGPLPDDPSALINADCYGLMWSMASQTFARPGLPSALALAIPFGSFGALDYLVGSADRIGACLESARLHFRMVASDVSLDIEALDDSDYLVTVHCDPSVSTVAQEFTLGCVYGRLKKLGGIAFVPHSVGLPFPISADETVRQAIYGEALGFGYAAASMRLSKEVWQAHCLRADPFLHATMQAMARRQELGGSEKDVLESAIRMRLRGLLRQHRASPAQIAKLIGISERTLQRRLEQAARSFSDILEDFRRTESTRLLHDPSLPLVEVASRLGYTEQTSFNRAFKRWKGTSPGDWRAMHAKIN